MLLEGIVIVGMIITSNIKIQRRGKGNKNIYKLQSDKDINLINASTHSEQSIQSFYTSKQNDTQETGFKISYLSTASCHNTNYDIHTTMVATRINL